MLIVCLFSHLLQFICYVCYSTFLTLTIHLLHQLRHVASYNLFVTSVMSCCYVCYNSFLICYKCLLQFNCYICHIRSVAFSYLFRCCLPGQHCLAMATLHRTWGGHRRCTTLPEISRSSFRSELHSVAEVSGLCHWRFPRSNRSHWLFIRGLSFPCCISYLRSHVQQMFR